MPTLTSVSHMLAATGFLVIAVLAATRWRGRLRGSLLLAALLVTSGWAAFIALHPTPVVTYGMLVAELAKQLAWIYFLVGVLGAARERRLAPLVRFGPGVVGIAALACGALVRDAEQVLAGVLSLSRIMFVSCLALAILGFVLVEQTMRNTRERQFWAAKLVWLAAGAVFAYDVAMFSVCYVLGGIEENMWSARGPALACVVPVLGVGLERVRRFEPRALMSQKLALYTTSVIVAGVYLVFVAFAGYYVRGLGGTWGTALQIVLVFVSLLGLAAVTFSSTARARVRVELAKHLYPYKYDYRTEWLDLTERLTRDREGSSLALRSVDAFARLARARSGGVWVLRDDVLIPAGGPFAASEQAPIERADTRFCRFLARHEWIVDLDAARRGRGRDAEVPVPQWLREMTGAWLAIPLVHEARLVALVVVGQPHAAERLTWEDLDLLRTAGRQAASYFALETAADALSRERQFAAFSRFSAFMMHDLSNILAQQQLIVDNAARHKHNPAFIDDAVGTIENTVQRMTRLLEQMKSGAAESTARRSVLVDVAERAVRALADRRPAAELVVQDPAVAAVVAADRLEHVLEHVIRNAQDATPPEGTVRVIVRGEDDAGVIEVVDTGRGMDPEFLRERLFRPFDTTKGAKGMGIGAFQTREFVRAAGGEVHVSSTPGSGTSFVIRLPRA